MHLHARKRIRSCKTRYDVIWAKMLYELFGLEAVVLFLKSLHKQSVEPVLREFEAQIGKNCDIESGITLHNAEVDFSKLSVGDLCHIGKDVLLDLRGSILILEGSTISMRTLILTHMDIGHASPLGDRPSRYAASVEIGPRTYVGAGAIILPGTRIGECSIVGAGSLVDRDVTAWTVVGGVPAKELRKIKS